MPLWTALGFRPVGRLLFRKPRPFAASSHGPAVAGESYSYPLPSTIVGALGALTGFRIREGMPSGDFEDHRMLLESLGVKKIRAGLLFRKNEWYAYVNFRCMPSLDLLAGMLMGIAADGLRGDLMLKALMQAAGTDSGSRICVERLARTGIARDRVSGSVIEGMLYTLDEVKYPLDTMMVFLASSKENRGSMPEGTLKLGGRGGIAHLHKLQVPADPGSLLIRGDGSQWLLVLISPALIEGEDAPENASPISSPEYASQLASLLLSNYGCIESSKVLVIPKGEHVLETIMPGWSLALGGAPRKPHLLIPPGTVIHAYTPESPECVRKVVENGLGAHSELGWGTILAVPMDRRHT